MVVHVQYVCTRPRIRGQFCRRGKYEALCLPPAASLMDGPVSRNLQLFLCDKIAPGFWACYWLSRLRETEEEGDDAVHRI